MKKRKKMLARALAQNFLVHVSARIFQFEATYEGIGKIKKKQKTLILPDIIVK